MDDEKLRALRVKAQIALFQLGEDAFEDKVVVAYDDTGLGFCPYWTWQWKVRAVPKHDVRININIADSTRCYLSGEDRIHIAFSPFEDEIEIRDFILPLLETETYREKQDQDLCCGERHIPGEAYHFESDRPF